MTNESREELISAYLDDEVSPAERVQVETWLAEDAECRRFCEELRALKSDMQSLARHQVAQDLVPAVIRRAERAVLSGGGPNAVESLTPGEMARKWWSQGLGWRRLVWPSIAVAAALVIAALDSSRQPQRQVAQTHGPRGESSIGAAPDTDRSDANPQAVRARSAKVAEQKEGALPAVGGASAREPAIGDRYEAKAGTVNRAKPTDMPSPSAASAKESLADKPAGASLERGAAKDELRKSARNFALPAQQRVQFEITGDVTEEFVAERGLEKMLDANKVAWQRDEAASPGETDRPPAAPSKAAVQDKKSAEMTRSYFVEATPSQRQQIVSELKQNARQVLRVSASPEAPAAKAAKSKDAESKDANSKDAAAPEGVEQFNINLRYTPAPPSAQSP